MNSKAKVIAAAALTALAAGCGTTVTPAAKMTPTAQSTSGAPPPSPPAQQQQARAGDRFTITIADGTKYDVTLQKVVQEALPASEFDAPEGGRHLAAAQFRVTAATNVDENANNNATATGSDEQAYTPSLASVAEGTNFANGDIRLQPGGTLVGWVAFELPDGVRITNVQWAPSAGFGTQTSEWLVTSSSGPSPGQTAAPAATVRAYFAAISDRDYALAWRLGGRNIGISYSSFVSGHRTTAKDTMTILSVAGDVVTARLVAQETDGTVKIFEGAYTVRNGVIVHFDVRQVG